MYKLPVWNTIGEGYRFILSERRAWFDYVLGPVVLVSTVPLLFIWLVLGSTQSQIPMDITSGALDTPVGTIVLIVVITYLLMIAIYVSFAVAWHRRYLLGPANTSARELITWTRRHWVFIGRGILLALLGIVVAFVIGFLIAFPLGLIFGLPSENASESGLVAFLVRVLATWAVTMLIVFMLLVGPLMVFPAAAVEDRGFGIRKGWKLASGNRWRMTWVYIFGAVLPVFVVQLLLVLAIAGTAYALAPDPQSVADISFTRELILGLISNAVYFLGIAIGVSMLSIMYRRLRDNVPLESEASA